MDVSKPNNVSRYQTCRPLTFFISALLVVGLLFGQIMADLGVRHLSNEYSNDRCRHDNGHIRCKPREYNGILESAL